MLTAGPRVELKRAEARGGLGLHMQGGAYIFLCLWLSGAEFVVHVSAEVWLALGVFEGEERTEIVRFL